MMEILGPVPKNFAVAGKSFDQYFQHDDIRNRYSFKRIKGLRHFPLKKLLTDKYRLKVTEAEQLADFLLQMLHWYPSDRATAQQMLSHPWLSMADEYNYKMTDLEYKKYSLKQSIENVKEQVMNQGPIPSNVCNVPEMNQQFECNVSELADSDAEVNAADDEDNTSIESADDTVSSISLSGENKGP